MLTATSGEAALTLLEQSGIVVDLIFMDIQMPGMNGLETTQRIRQQYPERQIPIIALTAHALGDEKESLLNSGMNDYQTKPINIQQLQHCIHKWTAPKDINNDDVGNKSDVTACSATPIAQAFDAHDALRLANGNIELAADMLQMLLDNLHEDTNNIRQAWSQQQQPELIEIIHKIHGATRYCGVPALLASMEALEHTLKTQTFDACLSNIELAEQEIARLQNWALENDWKALLSSASQTGNVETTDDWR